MNAISPIDQKFFELIIPIATFLTGTLSGIMLAGAKKEDQEAMLAAQKQAQQNADSAAKNSASLLSATVAPPKKESLDFSLPGAPMGGAPVTTPEVTPQVVNGFGGKPAPAQAPQPLL